ncbi:MAG: CRTAC1 family protein [Planctomycetota bacterium]
MPTRFSCAALAALLLIACGGGDPAPGAGETAPSPGAAPVTEPEPQPSGPAWFSEEAAARGLDFRHVSGHEKGRYLMPEIMGGGAALLDVEDDGDLDAYLVQSGLLVGDRAASPGNQLFLNGGDGTFRDATAASGAGERGYGMGVACGDVDGDGRVDLYVTNTGPNALLVNAGEARFRDATVAAGVGDDGFGASAAFVDYDRDGDLDLIALNYVHWSVDTELDCFNQQGSPDYCSPQTYDNPARDVFYRNRGDGTFEDATAAVGLGDAIGTGLGLASGDFNADGLQDVFVANDGMPDHLWVNQGDGTFRDDAFFAGCAVDQDGRSKAGMGVTVGDVDDDGDLDLLVCNLANQTDSFFRNEGGTFRDSTGFAGLGMASRPFTRFGMAWIDFDQDGQLDLYQANGRVNRQSRPFGDDPFSEPNLLFRGDGTRFREVLPRGGTEQQLIATSRAAAFGDVDGDGAVDVLVVNKDAPAHLLINAAPERGNWILLRVRGASGADAIGATVTLRVGERTVTRDVRAAYSYQASNDPRIHVGLGGATLIEGVSVAWPDGARESYGAFDANAVVVLERGAGEPLD